MAGKSNGAEAMQDWARAPPAALPFGKRFANFLYNPEDKSVLGRTPKRWGIVLTFYLCFYAVLAALFAACYIGLMRNIDKLTPHFTLTESLIGANPGVAFRPRNDVTGVLTYDAANTTALEKDIEAFLKTYEHEAWYINATECKARDNYGLPNTPCFFIKLNKIYDWEPQYYDADKIPLPAEMPEDLKAYIMSSTQRKQIWMSCEEEKKNVTQISYPWGRGLPEIYFPYRNAPGYRSPLLAVKVTPPTETSTEIIIRCRMWAANIHYDKSIKEARGYARIVFKITNTLSTS